jgi:hypothetical protein
VFLKDRPSADLNHSTISFGTTFDTAGRLCLKTASCPKTPLLGSE